MSKPAASFLVVTALLAMTAAGGCGKSSEPSPVIRVGHSPHDHHAPLYVAALNPDHFRERGDLYLREITAKKEYELVSGGVVTARVVIDSSVGGKELIRKLAEDHFDISFGGVPAMLAFIDKGAPIRIVSPVMAEGAGLVVPPDLPVDSWEEFLDHVRGREEPFRVGYKMGLSVQNLIFEAALDEVGISYSKDLDAGDAEIILVNTHGPKNLAPALEGGIIDGFVIMQPFLSLAEEKGIGKTIAMLSELPPRGRWEGNPCCALAASTVFVGSHPGPAEAFVTLMMRANAFVAERPGESAGLVAEWLGVPRPVEERSLPTIRFSVDSEGNWDRGVDFWVESMIDRNVLQGLVRESYRQGDHRELIYALELYRAARTRM